MSAVDRRKEGGKKSWKITFKRLLYFIKGFFYGQDFDTEFKRISCSLCHSSALPSFNPL